MVESRSAILVASLKVVHPYHMVVEIGVGGSVASAGCFPFVERDSAPSILCEVTLRERLIFTFIY